MSGRELGQTAGTAASAEAIGLLTFPFRLPIETEQGMEGGCTCGQIRYRLAGNPLIVHACHCRWCQRETGTAHALNALYEADRVTHIAGEPELIVTPSASGKGQTIARCPTCKVAVWSNYPQAGPTVRFVRVGTMDGPEQYPPDIHILPPRSSRG